MYDDELLQPEPQQHVSPSSLRQMLPWLYCVLAIVYLLNTMMRPCPFPELGLNKAVLLKKYGRPAYECGESRSNSLFAVSVSGFKLEREPAKGSSYFVYIGGWLGSRCTVVVFGPQDTTVDVVRGGT
jgi:hypothetical protein